LSLKKEFFIFLLLFQNVGMDLFFGFPEKHRIYLITNANRGQTMFLDRTARRKTWSVLCLQASDEGRLQSSSRVVDKGNARMEQGAVFQGFRPDNPATALQGAGCAVGFNHKTDSGV